MAEAAIHWRSVRVRITAVATAVTAVAVTLAAFGLLRVVEDSLVDRLRHDSERDVEAVIEQLLRGVPPDQVISLAPFEGNIVQVVDDHQQVLFENLPGADGRPLVIPFGQLPEDGGAFTIAVPVPGAAGEAALDVVFREVDTGAGPVTVLAASPLADVERSLDALRQALVFGLPLMVGLVAVVAWFVAGRALRPVDAIRAEVEAISASTIHRRVPVPDTGDEISRLARTMNAMLDRLEQSSRRQRQFVSDASHELRSPVATIRTELEVACRQGQQADWEAVAASVLSEEARLEALVSDLLLLASVDERGAGAGDSVVDVAGLAADEAGRARRLSVEADVADGLFVAGRPDHLRRVVANLLDNATRHARASVQLTASRRNGRVRLVVDDDGPGIPEADRARVFERFARLEHSRARDAGGAGLGLALVKSIVEHHRGTVWAEDSPLGGARLVVELPPAQPA